MTKTDPDSAPAGVAWNAASRSPLHRAIAADGAFAIAALTFDWDTGEPVLRVERARGADEGLRARLLREADVLGCGRVVGYGFDAVVPAPPPDAPRPERFLHAAARAATVAMGASHGLRDAPGSVTKADGSIGVAADAAGHEAAVAAFAGFDAVLLSEEATDPQGLAEDAPFVVVDPLDGTGNFHAGLPPWAFSAALVEGGRAVAGYVLDLTSGRRWWGAEGQGAWEDSRPITPRPGSTVVIPTPPEGGTALVPPGFRRLRCSGCTAIDLCLVASGAAAAWHDLDRSGTHVHDVAGGLGVLAGAGGVVLDPEGAPLRLRPDTVTKIRFAAAADMATASGLLRHFG